MSAIAVTAATVESEAKHWDDYVVAHASATVYHTWAWRRIFENAFGHETAYLLARRSDRIVGVLPLVAFDSRLFGRFMVSLPFVNYGGVIADDDTVARALLDVASKTARARRARHVELRHTTRVFPELPNRMHKVAMTLPVPSADDAWSSLDRKIRNQVRKAERSGLTLQSGGRELLEAFYSVFAQNMRDLGTPVYASDFFGNVLAEMGGRAVCFVVRHGNKPVAAAVTLAWRDAVEVPWASSLKAYRTECANILLYWGILQHVANAGARVLDLGRSSPDSGTYHFKRQWGAVPSPLCWEYAISPGFSIPDLGPSNPRFSAAIRTWQRLPLWFTTAVGPRIVRSIP
ncbi:MAG: FemAB family XrtA/PEP-CTERM system-associated protein [Vicinamibacterales bacterium]